MYFKQFLHDDLGCSSYFIASRKTRDAAVVDPQYDIRPYLELAADRGYTIRFVIDTHLHADHLSGNRKLAEATGATLALHESADVRFPFLPLKDGDEIWLGPVMLRVVHTPGHRPEAISLVVTNTERSPQPSIVLSGDTLFVGDVGRPDFGGPEGARQQYQSVQRLLRLEDWVEVFPAHFEGACGKGMCGRPSSTIGFERRYNPVLQLGQDQFEALAADPPARPLNMTAIVATNQGDADYGWVAAVPLDADAPEVSVAEAPGWVAARDAFILDVREPHEFEEAHIPGATLISQADLALRLDEIPSNRDILVVCASGVRSKRAAAFLLGHGYSRVASLAGGTNGWRGAGLPVEHAEALVGDG